MDSRYPDDWDERRREVYTRDKYICQNCSAGGGKKGNSELHAHHVVPISKGGSHQKGNLITLCSECHEAIHFDTMAPTHEKRGANTDDFLIPETDPSSIEQPDSSSATSRESGSNQSENISNGAENKPYPNKNSGSTEDQPEDLEESSQSGYVGYAIKRMLLLSLATLFLILIVDIIIDATTLNSNILIFIIPILLVCDKYFLRRV